ncbi:MAG: S1 RNA-binding domain-containing protein [Candidatus Odinarchaeota archaeon]
MLNYPEIGELVLVSCTKITSHGAYFVLTDYEDLGSEAGFVHISELSRTWVRNIRSHIKEGQRTVARVLRVNPRNAEVDMSIRRVSDNQRRAKLAFYKQETRSTGIVKAVGEKFGLGEEEIKQQINQPLKDNFGSISAALIQSREKGPQILIDAGISKEIAEELQVMAVKELEPPSVTLIGHLDLTVYEPNGIDLIKGTFEKVLSLNKEKSENKKEEKEEGEQHAEISELCSISAPRYRIVIHAPGWKEAEESWQSVIGLIEAEMKPHRAEFSYTRE